MWVALLNLPLPVAADEADDAYALARKFYQDKRWELSSQRFRTFLEDYPQHPRRPLAQLYLGLALVNLNDYRSARVELRRFVSQNPQNKYLADAAYRIGECSYLLNDFPAAEKEFQTYLKAAPQHALAEWALPYLGDTQLRLGNPTEAQRTLQQALARYPRGRMAEDARYSLAKSHEQLKEPQQAIELYQSLVANPQGRLRAQAQLRLGLTYFGTRDYAKAAAACDALVQNFSNSSLVPLAQMNAGFALYQLADYDAAIQRFDKLLNDTQRGGTAAYWKARSEVALTRYAEALKTIRATPAERVGDSLQEQFRYLEALALLRDDQPREAAKRFVEVVKAWPQGANADDAMHFAAESFLLSNQLAEAQQASEDFARQFPESPLSDRHDVLAARILWTRDPEKNQNEVTNRLNRVLEQSSDEEAQLLARIYLTRVQQAGDQHSEALGTIAPVIASIGSRITQEEATGIVLQATSLLALKRHSEVINAVDVLLQRVATGDQVAMALSLRAVAHARNQNRDASDQDIERLQSKTNDPTVVSQTLLDVAESAYNLKQWEWARGTFQKVAGTAGSADFQARGKSGAAWCLFETEQFADALPEFSAILEQHPQHPLASEAAQMKGRSLQALGQSEDAITAYLVALDQFAPASRVTEGRPEPEPIRRGYESGKLALQLLEDSQQSQRANQLYRDLTTRFPKAADADLLLERWAFALLDAEEFEASDRVFQKLIEDHPESKRVDNARYQLAESQLIVGNDLTGAEQAFSKLANSSNTDPAVRQASQTQLIRLAIEKSEWKRVEELSSRFLTENKESSFRDEVELHMANAKLNQNQLDPAESMLQELRQRWKPAVSQEESDIGYLRSRATLLLGEVYLAARRYDDLDSLVKDYASEQPAGRNLLELQEVQARSWIKRSEFALARDTFQKVIDDAQLGELEVAARSQLMIAESWFFEEKYMQAMEAYYLVGLRFKRFPRWVTAAQYQIGQCDEAEKRWTQAARAYQELIDSYPESEFAGKAESRLKAIQSKL